MINYNKLEKIKQEFMSEYNKKKQISKLIHAWKQIMAESDIKNNSFLTLTLSHINIESYGYSARITAPYGLNFNILEKLKPSIEHGIGCVFDYKYKRMQQFVMCQFIIKPIGEIDFIPIKVKPYELFLGVGIDSEPIIADMLRFPHCIDTGTTGAGKTKLIDCIITNLICNCTPQELGLYLIQVDKCDQAVYKRCKHTRAYANTIEKALAVTNYLLKVVEKRNNDLEPLIDDGIGNNIFDYNKHNITHKWAYLYLIIDEYSSLMPDEGSDDNDTKWLKKNIQGNMEKIAQLSRSTGLYIILGLQRSTVNKLPSFLKAMMNVNVAFRATNERSSYVAIDSNEAMFLDIREAIVKTNEKQFMKTVTLTNKMIVDFIDKYRTPKNQYKDTFDYVGNLSKKEEKKDKKSKEKYKNTQKSNKNVQENNAISNDFSKVDIDTIQKEEQEKMNNIKAIPNFVPFSKNKNLRIIDQTKVGLLKSEKPIKKGDVLNERND